MLAASHRDYLGVDVESIRRGAVLTEVAAQMLTEREAHELRSLQPHRRERRLVEYWTLKESYLKARGTGMSLPLTSSSYVFGQANVVELQIASSSEDSPWRWSIWQFCIETDFVLSICAQRVGAKSNITFRKVVPLISEQVVQYAPVRSTLD